MTFTTKSEKLFSYGTLQQEKVQLANFRRRLEGKMDALCGYRLEKIEITDPEVLAMSGEKFHPILSRSENSADKVSGMVFDVTEAELKRADEYEVAEYHRISVKLYSGVTAWVYVKQE